MKYIFLILVFIICGLIGFYFKNKYKNQYKFLLYINKFLDYLELNVMVYKNNLYEIINNYIIHKNNKNSEYNKIFQISKNTLLINSNLIESCLFDKSILSVVINFFNEMGKGDIENEIKKIKEFKKFISKQIDILKIECSTKGDLYFKFWIGIGVLMSILLW